MAKVCKKCKGYGYLHEHSSSWETDIFCLACPRAKPAIMRQWKRGRRCVIDKGGPSAIEGVLVKPPFVSPSKNWMVVVAIVESTIAKDQVSYVPRQYNVMLIKKRVSLI